MKLKLKILKGSSLFQYLAAATGYLTTITGGMHFGWPSPSLPKLLQTNSYLPITDSDGSWIAVMPLLGSLLGCIFVGLTVDTVGRKRSVVISSIPFFASWIIVAYARSVFVLCSARFLAGIADGISFTAIPIYIGEISEPRIRGMLGSGVSASWIFGILLINIIGSYQNIARTALISSAIPILALITFIWMPESPYYLFMRGKSEEARDSLRKFRGTDDVDEEVRRISSAVKAQTENSGKFLDLFTNKSNRKAVVVTMILRCTQQLSGTAAITFYTQPIFAEAGKNVSPELSTIIYFLVQLMVTCLCSGIVDKTGRRPLLIISMLGSAIALLAEGVYFYLKLSTNLDLSAFSLIPVTALILFVICFSLGMQAIPVLILGEIFPQNVKAFALCLAEINFSGVATVVSKFFQITKDAYGIHVPFFAFTLSCVVGLILIVLFVPETKGRTLEEIQEYFKTGKMPVGTDNKCVESRPKDEMVA